MRTFLFSIIFFISSCISLYSQVTYNPSCNSNASALTIEKIIVTDYKTTVYLKFYSTSEQTFWINSGTYIQKYGEPYSTKYYIKKFVGNELNKRYTNKVYTTYDFTWEFENIPKGITNISIHEPEVSGATSWYWKNITLNNPASSSMADFFKYEGVEILAGLAHPANTFKYAKHRVESNYVWVDIYYNDDLNTELKIERNGNFFTKIVVVYDNDFPAPFFLTGFIKDMVWELIEDNSDTQTKNDFERKINKTISEMNGKDLACLKLTFNWLDY